MKLTKSKQFLADAIHASGNGWLDGANWAWHGAVNKCGFFGTAKPVYSKVNHCFEIYGFQEVGRFECAKFNNWHQTILSRDEYFHLYPVAETAPEPVAEPKPTIEQLAADYRNKLDYANRKRQEADDAKAAADAALGEIFAAGDVLGLVIGIANPEPGLMITDHRDLMLGDIIEYVDGYKKDKIGMTGPVVEFDNTSTDGMHVRLKCDNGSNEGRLGWPKKWRFIRRP